MFIIHMDVKMPDIDKFIDEVEDSISAGMEALAEEVEHQWRIKAAQTLNTSKDEYLEGLTVNTFENEIHVQLTGELATAVEDGSDRFDMKPGFLGNRLSRIIPVGAPGNIKFRTVSAGSANWWHPGIQARSIGTQVQDELTDIHLQKIFSEAITARKSV